MLLISAACALPARATSPAIIDDVIDVHHHKHDSHRRCLERVQVPDQPWYMNAAFAALIGGILPFGAVFIELFFVLTSMWLHTFYYIFGFLALVLLILVVTCAEIAIVLCYFQLCSEDYHWWWRSFFTSGSSALYLFLYSAFYFYTKLDITKTVPMLMYFGYMAVISLGFAAITGTIGFYACYLFVRLIYGAVKID